MVTLPTFRRPMRAGVPVVPVSSRYLAALWRLQVITFAVQVLTVIVMLWRTR